jgi:hypothetical protein
LKRDAADADHPELQAVAARLLPRVQSGEMSAHAAAVEAGWRDRMVQIIAASKSNNRLFDLLASAHLWRQGTQRGIRQGHLAAEAVMGP